MTQAEIDKAMEGVREKIAFFITDSHECGDICAGFLDCPVCINASDQILSLPVSIGGGVCGYCIGVVNKPACPFCNGTGRKPVKTMSIGEIIKEKLNDTG